MSELDADTVLEVSNGHSPLTFELQFESEKACAPAARNHEPVTEGFDDGAGRCGRGHVVSRESLTRP